MHLAITSCVLDLGKLERNHTHRNFLPKFFLDQVLNYVFIRQALQGKEAGRILQVCCHSQALLQRDQIPPIRFR